MFNKLRYYLSKDGIDELTKREFLSSRESRAGLTTKGKRLPNTFKTIGISATILIGIGLGIAHLSGKANIGEIAISAIACGVWIVFIYASDFDKDK